MNPRPPRPAVQSSPIPSLVEVQAPPPAAASRALLAGAAAGTLVLAAGVVLVPRDAPYCGATRGDEVETHGARALVDLQRLEVARTLREIGLAMGWVAHERTTPGRTQGGVQAVVPTPPPVPETPIQADGQMRTTTPAPDLPRPGGIRPVHPVPHPTPPPPVETPVRIRGRRAATHAGPPIPRSPQE